MSFDGRTRFAGVALYFLCGVTGLLGAFPVAETVRAHSADARGQDQDDRRPRAVRVDPAGEPMHSAASERPRPSREGRDRSARTLLLPHAGAPPCTGHDPRQWHGLWNERDGCHYDHEHKDDPHLLDDVFGTWIYEVAGGSISYPWETPNENVHKHEAYGWIVARDMPPEATQAGDVFAKNLRIQAHLDLHGGGAPTRFHSNYIEVQICRRSAPNDCGIMRYGGWQDYGELRVDGNWVPLGPGDPIQYEGVQPPAVPFRDYDGELSRRGHSARSTSVSWHGRFGDGDDGDVNDTGGPLTPHIYSGFNHETRDAFGPVDPHDPHTIHFAGAANNNSTHFVRSYVLRVRDKMADANGRINWRGFTDRFGVRANLGCVAPGYDCVPMSIENVPVFGSQSLFVRPPLASQSFEYDVSPEGESWIRYPNE